MILGSAGWATQSLRHLRVPESILHFSWLKPSADGIRRSLALILRKMQRRLPGYQEGEPRSKAATRSKTRLISRIDSTLMGTKPESMSIPFQAVSRPEGSIQCVARSSDLLLLRGARARSMQLL